MAGSASRRGTGLGSVLAAGRSDLSGAENVEKFLSLAAADSVVGLAIVVLFKIGFEPLTKLKVVLVLCLGELADFDVALDAVLVEGVLENFVVLDEFVLVLGVPLDFAEGEGSRVEAVHDGAVD